MDAAQPTAAQPTAGWFTRWLYAIYFRSTALRFFFQRRIKPGGVLLLSVIVIGGGLGAGLLRSQAYQLFSLSVILAAIIIPWALLRRADLAATREIPRHSTAGITLRYTIRLTNMGKRAVSHAWLVETPPDPRPVLDDFAHRREPQESQRNRFDRTFARFRWQWLLDGNRAFHGGTSEDEIRLAPGASAHATITITPTRRGLIALSSLRVVLPDPLGFFQGCRKTKSSENCLIVLPRRYPLPPIEMPGSTAFQIAGEATTNALGQAGEFASLRDYRPGDPLRQIHWKSWARTGRPIVKEVEDTHYPRYGLIFDTYAGGENHSTFEAAVSVAASFAADIATEDSLLDLMFVNDQAYRVTAGRGVERAEKLLEALASITANHRPGHRTLLELVHRYQDDLTSCIVIFSGWDDQRAAFLRSLVAGGLICVPIIIGTGPCGTGAPGYWIDSSRTADGLARLPARLMPE